MPFSSTFGSSQIIVNGKQNAVLSTSFLAQIAQAIFRTCRDKPKSSPRCSVSFLPSNRHPSAWCPDRHLSIELFEFLLSHSLPCSNGDSLGQAAVCPVPRKETASEHCHEQVGPETFQFGLQRALLLPTLEAMLSQTAAAMCPSACVLLITGKPDLNPPPPFAIDPGRAGVLRAGSDHNQRPSCIAGVVFGVEKTFGRRCHSQAENVGGRAKIVMTDRQLGLTGL